MDLDRLHYHLNEPRYTYRSLRTLSKEVDVSEGELLRYIRDRPNIYTTKQPGKDLMIALVKREQNEGRELEQSLLEEMEQTFENPGPREEASVLPLKTWKKSATNLNVINVNVINDLARAYVLISQAHRELGSQGNSLLQQIIFDLESLVRNLQK